MYRFFLLLALAFTIDGNAQLIDDSVQIAGIYRTFHFNQPTDLTKGASLVFILHGSGGNGLGAMKDAHSLEAIREKESFIPVYPDGYHRYWNECRKYSKAEANKIDIDENGFFIALIDYFQKRYGIDSKKVFAAGFSGGGHMVYKFGLTMPGKFRALTAIVANMPDSSSLDCGEAHKAIPIMIVNGTIDQTNPYNGGEMFVDNTSFGVVRSTEKSFAYWSTLAGYKGKPTMKTLPNTETVDQQRIESYTYKQKGKPEVVLLKVIGGKHEQPHDIDVYVEAWNFFKRQLQ